MGVGEVFADTNANEHRGEALMSPAVQDLRTTRIVAEVFRGAMRQLATGVRVLTTGRDENIAGVTVT